MLNLRQAIEYISKEKPEILMVNIKSYVRIKRDIEQSILIKPQSYLNCHDCFEKWAWHNLKAMRRQAKLMVMGTEIRYK